MDIAKELSMEIDINYYLEKIVRICTYFINENDRYYLPLHIKLCNSKIQMKKKNRSILISRMR